MSLDFSHSLSVEDAARYQHHLADYHKLWKPEGAHEEVLVQALADCWWRLQRFPALEEALYAKGARELKDKVADLAPEARAAMLRLETFLAYEKHFRNLALQERRLAKHAAELKAELEASQKARDQKTARDLALASTLYKAAQNEGKPYNPQDDGFEFSTEDLDGYLRGQRAAETTGFTWRRLVA